VTVLRISPKQAGILVAVVFSFCLPLLAQQARPAIDQGIALEAAGKLDEALQQYSRAIALSPSLAEAWRRRGLVQNKRKAYKEALADFDRAIQLDAKDVDALKGRSGALASLERFKEAIDAAAAAIGLAPGDAVAYNRRAFPRFRLGDFQGAIEDATRAIARKPDYAVAYRIRGITRQHLNQSREALADLERAIELDSSLDMVTYHYRGIARRAMGDLKGALADAEYVLEKAPAYVPGMLQRGLVRSDLGNRDGAIADFRTVLQIQPNDATALKEVARLEAAAAPASSARASDSSGEDDTPDLKAFPDEVALLAMVRQAPTAATRNALARIRFDHAVRLAEASERSLDEDGLSAAIQYAESAAALAPDNVACWLLVGRLYTRIDDNPLADERAEEALTTALRLQPGSLAARQTLASLYFKGGSFDRAAGELERLVTADPPGVPADLVSMLAWSYINDFQADRGIAFLRGVIAKQPRAERLRIGLAALLDEQGDRAGARKELDTLVGDGAVSAATREYARALLADWAKGGAR